MGHKKATNDMEEEKSTLATSFLDVLSCGLGAAILLFLVFSVLPHQGVTQSSGQRDLVAGSATEIRELGVLIDDKEEVKSLNSTVLLKFPVTKTENKGLMTEELHRSVEVHGISPNLKPKNTSPDALIAKDVFELIDQSKPEMKLLCMRFTIPGGQTKGRKIRVDVTRDPPLKCLCRTFRL